MKGKLSKVLRSQKGGASIIITMVIMVIVTLLVTSFALTTRREQRRSLDRQLNTQAESAIETGIEDARAAISGVPALLDEDITNCTGPDSFHGQVNSVLTTGEFKKEVGENISYSCVLINQKSLTSINKTQVDPDQSAFIAPIDAGGSNINKIRVSWEGSDSSDAFYGATDYGLSNSKSTAPLLRIVLLPDYRGKQKDDLSKSAHTMFLSPNKNESFSGVAGSTNFLGDVPFVPTSIDAANIDSRQGQFVSGKCNPSNKGAQVDSRPSKYSCNVDISTGGAGKYYMVVQSLYKSASVDISAFGASDDPLNVEGQAIIDVTARAGDVIKRTQVRVPSGEMQELNRGVNPFAGAALATTDSLCKIWKYTKRGIIVSPNTNAFGCDSTFPTPAP